MMTIVRPTKGFRLNIKEIWTYRELIYILTLRDIKVRYSQTVVGVLWAVIQPVTMMVVFTVFFGKLAKVPSEGTEYPVFVYSALIPWQLFSRVLTEVTGSLVSFGSVITKVYFPRIIVPMSKTLGALVDFFIAIVILLILMVFYEIPIRSQLLFLPLFTLLLIIIALGVGFWLSILNVEFRDIAYVVPFINQFWFFITPVVYPTSIVPEKWKMIYALNPMVSVIDGFRWSLLGVGEILGWHFLVSVFVSLVLFVGGFVWFNTRERTIVDRIGGR